MEQKTIDLVHSVFCRKPHTHKIGDLSAPREDDICYYYLEGQVEHGENMEDHLFWGEEAQSIADQLSLDTDERMVKFMRLLGEVVGKASMLEFEYPGAKKILGESFEI